MKRVLALLLAAILALGMTTMAFAAGDPVKPVDQTGGLTLGYSATSGDTMDLKDVNPNSKAVEYIYLTSDMFSWVDSSGNAASAPSPSRNLTASEIKALKLGVRNKVSSGSKAIESITLESNKSRIKIKFVEEYVNTKELDFNVGVYLTVDGKRKDNLGFTFTGTLANPITDVYSGDDYVDTSDGTIAHAQEFVSKIQVDLGNGVSIFTKLYKGKKYYGTATREHDEGDNVVFSKYPDVDNVIVLKTVGLNSTGDVVKIDTDHSDYYVYDSNMKYLGQTSEMLPYSAKYYLANRKLDVSGSGNGSGSGDGNGEDPNEPDDGDGNGSGGSKGNASGNPNTGGNSFAGAAVAAGVVALAVAVSTRKRKK